MNKDYAKQSRRPNKARNTRHQPTRKTAPGWLWLVAGGLIGALAMNLILQGGNPETEPPVAVAPTPMAENGNMPKPRFDFYTLLKESEVIIADEPEIPATPVTVPTPNPDAEPGTVKIAQSDAQKTLSTETHLNSVAVATAPASATPDTTKIDDKTVALSPAATGPAATAPAATAAAATPPQPNPPKEIYLLQAGAFKSASDAENLRVKLLFLDMQAKVETVNPRPGETWHRVQVGPFSNTQSLSNARAILQQNGIPSIQVKKTL